MAYGKDTEVPFERSISEIVGLLKRVGADRIGQWDEREKFMLQFTLHGRTVEFRVSYPTEAELEKLRGPRQDASRVAQQWQRQRGRALLLVVKAKLESVESGVETFEEAFLANVVMNDGQTVYAHVKAPIALEYDTGKRTLLLGGPKS